MDLPQLLQLPGNCLIAAANSIAVEQSGVPCRIFEGGKRTLTGSVQVADNSPPISVCLRPVVVSSESLHVRSLLLVPIDRVLYIRPYLTAGHPIESSLHLFQSWNSIGVARKAEGIVHTCSTPLVIAANLFWCYAKFAKSS
jgi:hypothetical protein